MRHHVLALVENTSTARTNVSRANHYQSAQRTQQALFIQLPVVQELLDLERVRLGVSPALQLWLAYAVKIAQRTQQALLIHVPVVRQVLHLERVGLRVRTAIQT